MDDPAEHAWEARVVAATREGATVYVRAHRFDVGVPLGFDREAPRVTALEHALGALGAELVVGFHVVARRRRLAVDAVEATLRATLDNPLAYLHVVGEKGDPSLKSVKVRAYVTTGETPEAVEAAWREAIAESPLALTLGKSVALDLTCKPLA